MTDAGSGAKRTLELIAGAFFFVVVVVVVVVNLFEGFERFPPQFPPRATRHWSTGQKVSGAGSGDLVRVEIDDQKTRLAENTEQVDLARRSLARSFVCSLARVSKERFAPCCD